MAPVEKAQPTRAGQALLPPDERFWKRYSPHFELPMAGATSLFAHGLIVGILAVGGLAFLFRASAEASKPATMDTVAVDKDALFPGDLGGAPAGEPGYPGDPGRTEFGPGTSSGNGMEDGQESSSDPLPALPTLSAAALDFKAPAPESDSAVDLMQQLNSIGKTAEERSTVPAPPVPRKKTSGTKKGGGTRNPKGVGGARGPGGIGFGSKGPGRGGGAAGHKASDAEIKAWRWQFDLSGTPKEHADKLDKAGVIVAVPDPQAGNFDPRTAPLLIITDLKRRPITRAMMRQAAPGEFADSVKWYNRTQDSIQGLVQELRLPFVPACIVLLMPKDREQKMADLEMRFAQEHGIDFARIQHTTFDFRLQGGVYEPVVINQR